MSIEQEKHTKHKFFNKIQRIVAIASLSLGAGFMSIGFFSQAYTKSQEPTVQNVEARNHFYKVVAGAEQPSTSDSLNKLAVTLSDKKINIDTFIAPSGRYAGLEKQLGSNPFDNTGLDCTECGHLNIVTKSAITQIRNGNLSSVITPSTSTKSDGYSLTPLNTSFWIFIPTWWLFTSFVGFGAAYYADKYKNRYQYYKNIDWRLTKVGSTLDTQVSKTGSLIYAPWLAFTWPYCAKIQQRLSESNPCADLIYQIEQEIKRLKASRSQLPEETYKNILHELETKRDELIAIPVTRRYRNDAKMGELQSGAAQDLLDKVQTRLLALNKAEERINQTQPHNF